MILLFVNEKNEVQTTHYMPFDLIHGLGKTQEELEEEGGIFVNSIPQPEKVAGSHAVLKYENGELSYEYKERGATPEEELAQLKEQYTMMQTAIDDLIFGGGF